MPSIGNQSAAQWIAARQVIEVLRRRGHLAYLAGGCVRDLLLGRQPKDYDVATSATPDVVLDLFPRTFSVGAHFGVVLVSMEISGQPTLTEVATFRSDGAYSDGRRPDAVRYTLSPQEDVQRRDFTINGLLLDLDLLDDLDSKTGNPGAPGLDSRKVPETWNDTVTPGAPGLDIRGPHGQVFVRGVAETGASSAVLDHVDGLKDLEAGLIRAIGQPHRRFEEDHLRMLRAVRFAARFHFAIDPATHAAIRSMAAKILAVSRERIRDELTRMLTEGNARRAFELLHETALLPQVLPEVARLQGVAQPPQYHPEGDVWTHTLLLLSQLQAGCPATLAWGALLHDIGKPATFRAPDPSDPSDRIRFNGHVEVGVRIAAEILRRLRFSNEDTSQILALVENHMRFADTPRMKTSTLKRFFRLDRFEEHLALHKMDCLASSLNFNGNLSNYHFARQAYESMPALEVRPSPLVTGHDLIQAGYPPGALFKTILHAVEEAQLEGSISTPEEAMDLLRSRFPLPTASTQARDNE
jgi:poly(A) polymerase